MRTRFVGLQALLILLPWLPLAASGQLTDIGNTTTTPMPGPGREYLYGLNEIVTPSDGSVSLRIAVATPPGRRLTVPFSFNYDSNGIVFPSSVSDHGLVFWSQNQSFLYDGGWSYGVPTITYSDTITGHDQNCEVLSSWTLQDASGTRATLPLNYVDKFESGTDCPGPGSNLAASAYDYRGSFFFAGAAVHSVQVDDPDGSIYSFNWIGGCGGQLSTDTELPNYIEDRNGNQVTFSSPRTCDGTFTATDTLGNAVITSSGFGVSGNTVSIKGLAHAYTINWGSASANYSISALQMSANPSLGCPSNSHTFSQTNHVVTSIALPDLQTAYTFSYDPTYGTLTKITYPNGGYVQYTWGINPTSAAMLSTGDVSEGSPTCGYVLDTYAVQHRYVSYDGTTIAEQQDFSYTTNWKNNTPTSGVWTSKQTMVTTHDLIAGTVSTTTYLYLPIGIPGGNPNAPVRLSTAAPFESTITYANGSGSTLKTLKTETEYWTTDTNGYPYLQSKAITLDTGQTAQTNYSYEQYPVTCCGTPYNGPAELSEIDAYDFGSTPSSPVQMPATPSTPLLRKTLTTYQGFAGSALFQNFNFGSQTPYNAPTIFDRPCKVLTQDGSGTTYAETDYYYDGQTTLCGGTGTTAANSVSAVPGGPATSHDETNFSTSSTVPRGDATEIAQRCLHNCTGETDSITTYAYDATGQVSSRTDGCGNGSCADMSGSSHTTHYVYTDSPAGSDPAGQSNAYLTSVTAPSTGGVSHVTDYSYNYSTGELASTTDENDQTTSYNYSDPLLRLTDIYAPAQNGGAQPHTHYSYTDGPGAIVTVTGPTGVGSTSTLDGLGRTIQTQSSSDPIFVNTVYNGIGSVFSVTNPHRSSSSPTDGTTYFAYDALGRKTLQTTQPDGNKQSWVYSGNAVTFTDESQNLSKSTSDALGRLTTVVEALGALNLTTNYTYDPLSNLQIVSQLGDGTADSPRTRTFTYDSLARLVCASNPENSTASCPGGGSGTLDYVYDANGNVSSKADARGVVTTYRYDDLNRLISKNYSGSAPAGSLASCYQFDTASNGIGRLGSEWTQPGSCPASPPAAPGYQSLREIGAYDAMGLMVSEQQCILGFCTSSSPPTPPSPNCTSLPAANGLSYCYDLAGNVTAYSNGLTSSAFPQQNILFSQSFDAVGRLSAISSSLTGTQLPGCLFNAQSGTATSPCTPLPPQPAYSPANNLENWTLGNGVLSITKSYDNRLRVSGETATQQ